MFYHRLDGLEGDTFWRNHGQPLLSIGYHASCTQLYKTFSLVDILYSGKSGFMLQLFQLDTVVMSNLIDQNRHFEQLLSQTWLARITQKIKENLYTIGCRSSQWLGFVL